MTNHCRRALFSAICILTMASCRETITGEGEPVRQSRTVADFKEVQMDISGDLEISQGTSFALAVEAQGNLQPAIRTEVKGDELIITTDKNIKADKRIRLVLTMPALEGVEVSGSGSVTVKDMFEPETFRLDLSGSGNFKGQFSAKEIETEINGSGDVDLSGRADRHEAQINGSGNVRAGNLETRETQITINGSGDAELTVLDRLDVGINGSGDVTFRGNPPHINTSVNGSGRVNRR